MFVTHKIVNYREEFILFLNNIINLLTNSCSNNKLNCFYVFQWHSLFIEMVLKSVNPEDDEKCKLNVDELIETIFNITGFHDSKDKQNNRHFVSPARVQQIRHQRAQPPVLLG